MDLLLTGFALLLFLFAFISFFGFNTLNRWQEAHLQILQGSASHRIGFIFFAALGLFLCRGGLRIHTFRLTPIWHRSLLALVCIYTFVFFNPQANFTSAKDKDAVYCPDGYAFRLETGHYISCEHFDLFHEEQFKGITRADLYLKGR